MTKLNQILSALALSFTTYLAGTASASAFTFTLNWTGTGDVSPPDTYSLTGSFTGNDTVVPDGFIRSSDGEITDFSLRFIRNTGNVILADYVTGDILGDTSFNFNFQTSDNTIFQTGGSKVSASALTGLSIGNSVDGYSLDSFASASNGGNLTFNDFTFTGLDSASGGTLTATAVPFEFDATAGVLTLGAIFGINQWRKNRLKK